MINILNTEWILTMNKTMKIMLLGVCSLYCTSASAVKYAIDFTLPDGKEITLTDDGNTIFKGPCMLTESFDITPKQFIYGNVTIDLTKPFDTLSEELKKNSSLKNVRLYEIMSEINESINDMVKLTNHGTHGINSLFNFSGISEEDQKVIYELEKRIKDTSVPDIGFDESPIPKHEKLPENSSRKIEDTQIKIVVKNLVEEEKNDLDINQEKLKATFSFLSISDDSVEIPEDLKKAPFEAAFWTVGSLLERKPEYKDPKYLPFYLKVFSSPKIHQFAKKGIFEQFPCIEIAYAYLLNVGFDHQALSVLTKDKEFVQKKGCQALQSLIESQSKNSISNSCEMIEAFASSGLSLDDLFDGVESAKKNESNFMRFYGSKVAEILVGHKDYKVEKHGEKIYFMIEEKYPNKTLKNILGL